MSAEYDLIRVFIEFIYRVDWKIITKLLDF